MIFRYPGGKSKLLPPIMDCLDSIISTEYHDVFTGGGSVLCAVAKQYPDVKLFANDLDTFVYSFWSMFERNSDVDFSALYSLVNQMPTVERFFDLRNNPPEDVVGRAYYAIFFNRTTFSGIQSAGPIGGREQKSKWSVSCRYNPKAIISGINTMRTLFSGRLKVTNKHFADYLSSIGDVACYLDPPYFKKGRELYPVFMKHNEHVELAESLSCKSNWLLSYDICDEIERLYQNNKKIRLNCRYSINGKKAAWVPKDEFLILGYENESSTI